MSFQNEFVTLLMNILCHEEPGNSNLSGGKKLEFIICAHCAPVLFDDPLTHVVFNAWINFSLSIMLRPPLWKALVIRFLFILSGLSSHIKL